MTALIEDTPITKSIGEKVAYPVLAATLIYQGSAVGLTAAGYARPYQLGDRFIGHTPEGMNNSNGASGDVSVTVFRGQYYMLLNLSGVAITDAAIRASVYVQDSGTYSLRVGFKIGEVVHYRESGYALVLVDTDPQFNVLAETVVLADFTDVDTTGYADLSTPLPEGSLVLGWQADVKSGFTGDSSATVQVGEAGNVDRFSAKTDNSCFTADVVGTAAPAVAANQGYLAGAVTPRVTVTGGSDFGSVSAGEMDIKIIYAPTLRV
ncbi:hypothetical protein V6x_28480 [Gimesia chilikensis]|uniref:Uncharacterized protein n=1 Tax=Gimesia chilikensis TaxID=2605989 RepID=A0A517WD00_9PLAN|nr:hypothetical protein [Gimesia chilikensis]QDU03136.1 hypothetical protein V6x_28480 [Gimesia chilikensis]